MQQRVKLFTQKKRVDEMEEKKRSRHIMRRSLETAQRLNDNEPVDTAEITQAAIEYDFEGIDHSTFRAGQRTITSSISVATKK